MIYASLPLHGRHTLLNYAKPFMQPENVTKKNIATYFAGGTRGYEILKVLCCRWISTVRADLAV